MSAIAFYAPLKSPDHPTPSGDREMARGVLKALNNVSGFKAKLVSTLRTYDGRGEKDAQDQIVQKADVEKNRLIDQGAQENWALWLTYHNYYKAPDLLGPAISQALGIPYVLLEATRAKKRLTGPWANFAALAEHACDQADIIFYFTERDFEALHKYHTAHQKIVHLAPFLAEQQVTASQRIKPERHTILSVGMMRQSAKIDSYRLIAETLTLLKTQDWHLNIIGDGPARLDVQNLFQRFKDRVSFLGQLAKPEIKTCYKTASVFLWPGVDEAFGMTYLEAQSAGLPVVAQNRPGVRDVIAPEILLAPVNQPKDMAKRIDQLFANRELWEKISKIQIDHIQRMHLIGTASQTFNTYLNPLIARQNA